MTNSVRNLYMDTTLTLWVALFVLETSHGFVCPRDFCARVRCRHVSARNCRGYLSYDGSVCGCCRVCIRTLGLGQSCWSSAFRGLPRRAVCRRGLICDPRSLVCRYPFTQWLTRTRAFNNF
uniref:Putative secreted protein n=1 Tax=Amblyomma americanum TaxID=6943 RepID=A0A0C9SDC8_AMBAM